MVTSILISRGTSAIISSPTKKHLHLAVMLEYPPELYIGYITVHMFKFDHIFYIYVMNHMVPLFFHNCVLNMLVTVLNIITSFWNKPNFYDTPPFCAYSQFDLHGLFRFLHL